MDFFGQLIDSMGQNIEFKIGNVCEGDDFTAGVTWHLGISITCRLNNDVLHHAISNF